MQERGVDVRLVAVVDGAWNVKVDEVRLRHGFSVGQSMWCWEWPCQCAAVPFL